MKLRLYWLLLIVIAWSCVSPPATPPPVQEIPPEPEKESIPEIPEPVLEDVSQEIANELVQDTSTPQESEVRSLTQEEQIRLGQILMASSIALIPMGQDNISLSKEIVSALNDQLKNDNIPFFDVDAAARGFEYHTLDELSSDVDTLFMNLDADICIFFDVVNKDESSLSLQLYYLDHLSREVVSDFNYLLSLYNDEGETVDLVGSIISFFPVVYKDMLTQYSMSAVNGLDYTLVIKGLGNSTALEEMISQVESKAIKSSIVERSDSEIMMNLAYIGSNHDLQEDIYNLLIDFSIDGNVLLETQTLNELVFDLGL